MEQWTFPARGTWIEMPWGTACEERDGDVPRKGNVDRNKSDLHVITSLSRRSPQGERG